MEIEGRCDLRRAGLSALLFSFEGNRKIYWGLIPGEYGPRSGVRFPVGLHATEEAGIVVDVEQSGRCGKDVSLTAEVLMNGRADALNDSLLGGVAAEGIEFAVAQRTEFKVDGPGNGGRAVELWMVAHGDEGGAGVVELLRAPGLEPLALEVDADLFGEEFRSSCPMEGRGGGKRNDDVVAMEVDAAVSAEGEDDLRSPAANVSYEGSDNGVEVFVGELAISEVENLMSGDTEELASVG